MLLVAVGFALTGLADTVVLLGLTVLIWTLGEMTINPRVSPAGGGR